MLTRRHCMSNVSGELGRWRQADAFSITCSRSSAQRVRLYACRSQYPIAPCDEQNCGSRAARQLSGATGADQRLSSDKARATSISLRCMRWSMLL